MLISVSYRIHTESGGSLLATLPTPGYGGVYLKSAEPAVTKADGVAA
jgi:hypothetical protein